MLYYNYEKNQMLILDQEEPEVILYQFNNKIQLVHEVKLETIEALKILGNKEEWSLI